MALTKSNIELDSDTTRKQLAHLAIDHDMTLQRFIEAQLIAIGDKGISYLDLWRRCEAMTIELKQLSKEV